MMNKYLLLVLLGAAGNVGMSFAAEAEAVESAAASLVILGGWSKASTLLGAKAALDAGDQAELKTMTGLMIMDDQLAFFEELLAYCGGDKTKKELLDSSVDMKLAVDYLAAKNYYSRPTRMASSGSNNNRQ